MAFWEVVGHSALHALIETAKVAPFLILFYIVIELLEQKVDLAGKNRLGGALGPLIGSATGLVPQCGFSVMAAKLFEKKYITIGTLMAIFMATSDEAFIVLFSGGFTDGKGVPTALALFVVKLVVGVAVGYATDGILRLFGHKQVCAKPIEAPRTQSTTHDIFITRYLEDLEEVDSSCSCGKPHETDRPIKTYLLNPLWHATQIILVIFLVNFLLTALIEGWIGEETFSAFMQNHLYLQPLLTALVGLIPNCASSVVITETYLEGGIAFGSLVAGLCANAGLGFFVLLKNVKKWKRNLLLVVVCYVIAVGVGMLCNLLLPLSFSV